MKTTITRQGIVFVILFIYSIPSFSQTLTQSPYSRFGLGELQREDFAQNAAMGGVTQSFQSNNLLNISNPASLGALKYTTFQASLSGIMSQQSTSLLKQKAVTSSFNSISLAFPITKWWGAGFGLKPYSNMAYNINYNASDTIFGNVNYSFKGDGGITKVFISNGFQPIKNLFIGANAMYMFGVLNKQRKLTFENTNYINTISQEATNINGFNYNVGAQFKIPLKLFLTKSVLDTTRKDSLVYYKKTKLDWREKEYAFQFGLTVQNNSVINGKTNELVRSYRIENDVLRLCDTVSFLIDNKGKITLPQTIGAGISFKKGEKLFIGVDYYVENWSQYSYFGLTDLLQNSSLLCVGAQYTPKPGFLGNSFERASYRIGYRTTNSYLNLKNTPIIENLFSVGAGFPMRRSTSSVNVSFEFGTRGTLTNDLIKEDFFRFNVGFSLNDVWFIKRRID